MTLGTCEGKEERKEIRAQLPTLAKQRESSALFHIPTSTNSQKIEGDVDYKRAVGIH